MLLSVRWGRRPGRMLGGFGRLCARHRGPVLGLAAAAALLLGLAAAGLSDHLSNGGYTAAGTESARADRLLSQRFGTEPPDLILLVDTKEDVDDDETADRGRRLTRKLAERPGVTAVRSYWSPHSSDLRSRDRRSALIAVVLEGDEAGATRTAERLVPHAAELARPFALSATGPAWTNHRFIEQGKEDQRRAEVIVVPLTILILLATFGSLYAALIPAVVGALAVIGTLALMRPLSEIIAVSVLVPNLATAIGFGLAIDYSLFVVTRYREELARGLGVTAAIERAMATAGRTVLFSAVTVMVALSGLLVIPLGALRSLACSAITVVLMAAAAALLVLPALLAVIGTRISRYDAFAWLRREPPRRRPPVLMGGTLVLAVLTLLPALRLTGGLVRWPGVLALGLRLRRALFGETTSPERRTPPLPAARQRHFSVWGRSAFGNSSRNRAVSQNTVPMKTLPMNAAPGNSGRLRKALRAISGAGRTDGTGNSGRTGRRPVGAALSGLPMTWLSVRKAVRLRRAGASPYEADSPTWRRIARAVTRRPVLFGGGCALALVLVALPFGHARFGLTDERILPADVDAHAVSERVGRDFAEPVGRGLTVVLPEVPCRSRLERYAERLSAQPHVIAVRTTTGEYVRERREGDAKGRYKAKGAVMLTVSSRLDPQSQEGRSLVENVRAVDAPGRRHVTGAPAHSLDTLSVMEDELPKALAIIAAATFLLLFLFTGGVLVAFKALLLGALSLTASFGAVVWVFQDGHAEHLVGEFAQTGRLDAMTLLLAFTIAFGLSIDYEVFLLSRIKEAYAATGRHTESIVTGIARTGRLVTAAALAVAVSMGSLLTSENTVLKMNGLGLALAVLVDATLVRGLLVPAFMRLTGPANWWAPAPLARLHHRAGLAEAPARRRFVPRKPRLAVLRSQH